MLRTLTALTLLALVGSGCVQSDLVLRVQPDGSGTIEQEFLIGQQMLDMMVAFGDSAEVPTSADLLDEDSLRASAARYGEGVRFVSATPTDGPGIGGTVVYAFDDVSAVRLPLGDEGGGMSDMGLPGVQTDEDTDEARVTFGFDPGTGLLTVNMPHGGAVAVAPPPLSAQAADSVRQEIARVAMMASMMGDARIRVRVEAPGGIAETTAAHRDGEAVTLFDVSVSGMIADPDLLLGLQAYERAGYGPFEAMASLQDSSEAVTMEPQPAVTLRLAGQ